MIIIGGAWLELEVNNKGSVTIRGESVTTGGGSITIRGESVTTEGVVYVPFSQFC